MQPYMDFQQQSVRRHPDGSINFDFYRASAAALRRQAMRDSPALRTASASALVMAGALGFAVVIPSIAAPTVGERLASAFPSWSQTR